MQPAESVAIVRTDRRGGGMTRLATAATPQTRVQVTMEGKQVTAVNVMRAPFAVGDEWVVASDGTLPVARRAPYRLDLVPAAGSLVRGVVVPAEELPVTPADKREYLSMQPNGATIDPNTIPWPQTKPVFLPGAVVVGIGGETWVRRATRAGATVVRYDVFDRGARLVATATMPVSHRLMILSSRGAIVVRTDDDGLQFLERYALPR